jgi:hypothetical protein
MARLYGILLRTYPVDFRLEFEDEMREVFDEAMADAGAHGSLFLMRLIFREILGWIRLVSTEHVQSLSRNDLRRRQQTNIRPPTAPGTSTRGWEQMSEVESNPGWVIDGRRAKILAALPPLLLGLGIMLVALIMDGPYYQVPRWRFNLAVGIGLLPIAALAAGGLHALLRRLPDWGYTWVGANLMGMLLLLMGLGEDRPYLLSPAADIAVVVIILLAASIILIFAAYRGLPQASAISLGLSSTLGLSLPFAAMAAPFNRFDLALLAGPAGLLLSGLLYIFHAGSARNRSLSLLGVAASNFPLLWTANTAWRSWYQAQEKSPWPLLTTLLLILLGMLLVGPTLGLIMRPIRNTLGQIHE